MQLKEKKSADHMIYFNESYWLPQKICRQSLLCGGEAIVGIETIC